MDAKEIQAYVGKPQIARLKALGKGLKVGKVMGSRVLVIAVEPWTEMDEVEQKGLIHIPKAIKKDNTPLPTTGIIVQLGPDVHPEWFSEGDMVMFPKFAGNEFIIAEENMRIMDAKEILCTLVDVNEEVKEVPVEAANLG